MIDITNEVHQFSKKLSFLQVVTHQSVSMDDMMHAHEINDPKIDPKNDICEEYTISSMISKKRVLPSDQLSTLQIKDVYCEVLKMEALVLEGQPLAQTIYRFSYLYDQSLWKDSVLLSPLLESISTLGAFIYDLHKESCSIKDDDMGFSTFSFKKDTKSNDEVMQLFILAEKQVESSLKTEKDQARRLEAKQLISMMKLRRSIHALNKTLGKTYDIKAQAKIESDIKSTLKRLNQCDELMSRTGYKSKSNEKVFSETLRKTIRSHFGPREIPNTSVKDAMGVLRNGLSQFEMFFPLSNSASQYRHKMETLSYLPNNLWSKSYIKVSIFKKEDYFFSAIKSEDIVLNDMKCWCNLQQDLRNDQKFETLLRMAAPIVSETLFRMFGSNAKWFWECSKIYEDFNYLIHIGNEIDSRIIEKKKESFICSWLYNWALSLMTRQILWGFEEDLYEQSQYSYVCFYLQYLLHINQKNSNLYHNRIDKSILEFYFEGSLGKNKKKKKSLTLPQKRYLADSLFKKGLHYYFKSLFKLMAILIEKGHLENCFKDSLELRIDNRFRIFKGIYFIKRLGYEEYKSAVEEVVKQQKKHLEEVMDLLKQAKNIFSLFNQFEGNECFIHQLEDAVALEKLSGKLFLVAMTLKMSQPKKYCIKKEWSRYPEISLS